ncbi:MAG: response regulator [Chitinivibrionales bacterium]|nr:response regulator [Chitinivibrionales bacterium]
MNIISSILSENYYFLVTIFTALYSIGIIIYLSERFHYSRPSRGLIIFLVYIFLWSVKDSFMSIVHDQLTTSQLLTMAVVLSPLWLFSPNAAFSMLISVYNSAAPLNRRFRKVKQVHVLMAGMSLTLYLVSLINPAFMFATFSKGTLDYNYSAGPAFYLFFAVILLASVVPSISLLRISLNARKSEAFFVGAGALFSLAVIIPGNIIPPIIAESLTRRMGCLSVSIMCGFTFLGIVKYGHIFSVEALKSEKERWKNISLSLQTLVEQIDVNQMFQSICSYANEISESEFVCVLTFNTDLKSYQVKALAYRDDPVVEGVLPKLPVTLYATHSCENAPQLQAFLHSREIQQAINARDIFAEIIDEQIAAKANEQLQLQQIVSVPIMHRKKIQGAMLFFRRYTTEEKSTFKVFSMQCSLILKFSSQIRELQGKKKLEEALVQAQKMEAIGLLAGGVAHDFNNLLAGISGFARLIKRKHTRDNPGLETFVDPIIDATVKGSALTKQLLAFARKGNYQVVALDAEEIVQDVIGLLSRTIDKRIEIKTVFQATSPVIMGDPAQVQNALLNLGLNSRDAMPNGGVLTYATAAVTVDDATQQPDKYRMQPGDYVVIIVSDTGIGMDNDTCQRMFEPFFTTKATGKGTGLGLAGVYGAVKGHNGYVEVESSPGAGTEIKVLFPAAVDKSANKAPAKFDNAVVNGKGHVLIVDDEDIVRDSSKAILTELGYSVSLCKDGKEAIELYKKRSRDIDLVILDMIMPVMGGYDCFSELQKINPDVKAIIATGYSISEDTQRIATKGIAGFIQKPFDDCQLSQIIANALNQTTRQGAASARG